MTERETELRLRAALTTRAESAMSLTDTPSELDRFTTGIERQTRQRRVRIAVISVAAAAAVAGVVIGLTSLGGGSTHGTPAGQPSASASTSAPPAQPVVVPAGFPIGQLAVAGSATHQALIIVDTGDVTLSDAQGQSGEKLTFPSAGHVTFSSDQFLCQTAGSYRYTATATSVRFTVVTDTCSYRVTFLTTGTYTK
jgi:hypothetical protein